MNRINELLKKIKEDRKMLLIILLGIVGILLIVFSECAPEKSAENIKKSDNENISNYEADIEENLCNIISQINGVGRAQVMITFKCGEENKYAYNENTQSKKNDDTIDSKTENEYIIIDSQSGEECVLLKTEYPRVCGVIVVCEGGDDISVKNDITLALSALLDISTNNISVLKMKKSEE